MTESLISQSLLEELIPQKRPFVMLSHLLEVDESKIVTGFQIPTNNIFVEDGFFGESGLVENIAQTVALYTGYNDFLQNKKSPVGYIGAINNVQVYSLPLAGSFIQTEVQVITEFMGVTMIQGQISCNKELIVSLKMKTVLANQIPENTL
jgi:3-hydroxyacyl-[acyl-carrier-protein] dehydratase